MKKIIQSISIILTAIILLSFMPTIYAQDEFYPESYIIEGENTAVIEFNKNISQDCTKDFSIVDALGVDITSETEIEIKDNIVRIELGNINNGLKYYVRISKDLESEEGDIIDKAHSYIVEKNGKTEDFNVSENTTDKWKYCTKESNNECANIVDNKLLIAGETGSSNNILYNKNPVLVYDADYLSFDYKESSVLEYDFVYNTKGTRGNNYDCFSVFFCADEFVVNDDKFSSEKGAYIFRVYDLGKKTALIKWDGSESKIGAENAGNKFNMGTVLSENNSVTHDIGKLYKYRISAKATEEGNLITVTRYAYNDGSLDAGENIISYVDESVGDVGGSFYFMSGASLKNNSVSYLNSYCVDNVIYSDGEWKINEYIEPTLNVQCKVESNIVEIDFSEEVEEDSLYNNIKIYSGDYTNEVSYEIELSKDGKNARLYIDLLEPDREYFVDINKALKSKLGYKMADGYLLSFKTKGFYSTQKAGDEKTDEYKIFHSTTKNAAAYLYDSMIYMTRQAVGTNVFENCDYSTGVLLQKADYDKYIYENATLEFDYKNFNSTTVKGNGNYSGMRLYFNADPYINEMGQWDTNISAKKGAYVLTIYPYMQGSTHSLRLGLNKWDGTKYAFSDRTTLVDTDTKTYGMKSIVKENNVYDYETNGKLRIRVKTKKLSDAEQIDIYVASYSGDTLGEYERVLSYTDYSNPYTEGTFYFTACPSNAAYVNGYISSHLIGNIMYMTTDECKLEKIQDVYDKNKDNIEGYLKISNISADEYNDVKYYYTLAQLAKNNGIENIAGLEELKVWMKMIPSVAKVAYTDEFAEHKIKIDFNNSFPDEMFSKDYIKLYCDGSLVSDYTVEKSNNGKSCIVITYNNREYKSVYDIIISGNIVSDDGMQIDKAYEYTVVEKAQLLPSEIVKNDTIEGSTYLANVKNMTSDIKDCFAVMTLIRTDIDTGLETLVDISLSKLHIPAGEVSEISLLTDSSEANQECRLYIYNSQEELKQMYKTIVFKTENSEQN